MLGRTDRRLRLVALLAVFLLVAGALVVRHAYWAVARSSELATMAAGQLEASATLAVQRGAIYDRKGNLLATTAYRDRLVAFPAQIPAGKGRPMADQLAGILGLDATAAAQLRTTLGGSDAYAIVARDLSEAQSAAIRAKLAAGTMTQLELEPQPVRVYPDPGGAPESTLASQLLGFVNAAGTGQYGVEQRYDQVLAGRPQVVQGLRDAAGRPMSDSQTVVDPGQPGADLRLTIDASLQLQLEKELYAAWVADKAASASAVILDPHTGAVLAWASVPGYDANEYRTIASRDPGRFVDPVVSTVYEPGSVMKMFVATAAYRAGTMTPSTRVRDSGTLRIGRNRVSDADRRAMGWMRFEDGIAYSRNVVAAKAAFGLGKSTPAASRVLYAAWHDLGLGSKTGADVANEVAGLVADPATHPWAAIDLANRSFGQGVAVTPLQLASAYCTMINGGYRVTPHVVAGLAGQDVPVARGPQVLSTKLSAQLRALMVHVVTSVPYYRAGTTLPGYVVGGKTGTAQIWDSKANDWVPDTYNFSFVGFVGRETPAAVVAVRLDHVKPKILRPGSLQLPITSYELFRRIAQDIVGALDLPPLSGPGAQAPAPTVPADAPTGPGPSRPLRPAVIAAVGEWRPNVTKATSPPPPDPGLPAYDAPGLSAASGGRLVRAGSRPMRAAAVDSRRVAPGNVFVALPGARTDGHRFLAEAVRGGATGLLVTDVPSTDELEALGDVTVVAVADGLAALQALASDWRARFEPLVVGVTGSLAKTSTKEAAAAVLATRRAVLASAGNENNEIGLPLTLLRLTPQVEVAVLEMGMYVEGEIAQLARIARPHIGVVTAVRGVHLERAGSLDAIEREKGRLVEALPAGGTAILNADDPRVARMRARTAAGVVTYGLTAGADVTADAVESRGDAGMRFVLRAGGGRVPVETPVLGRHNVHNALAAAAVGLAAGLPLDAIVEGLAAGWGAPHRSVLIDAGPWRLLDDTYNASPDTMAAALELLGDLPARRRVAVLGEMLELGDVTEAEHLALGERAAAVVDLLVTVGEGGQAVAAAARAAGLLPSAVVHVDDAAAAAHALVPRLRPGDLVLIKGSRGVALEALVEQLEAAGSARPAGSARAEDSRA